MNLDTQTLIFILSLSLLTQVIALFVQYQVVHKTFRGIAWFLLGSSLMALGFVLMPLVNMESLVILAMISNPMMVLGQILIYVGIVQFLNKSVKHVLLGLIYLSFLIFYYSFMFIENDISNRTLVINLTLCVLSFLTSNALMRDKRRFTATSVKFSAFVFLAYAILLIIRIFWILSLPSVQNYQEYSTFLNVGFIFSTIASMLWTYGFILMVNQHLNEENRLEKEKMHLVFNTSPDAALLSRLSDGLILDVNRMFTKRYGYTRDEILGATTKEIKLWSDNEDRNRFVSQLDKERFCENLEFSFQRKEGSTFDGMISASVFMIQEVPHVISVIRDISEQNVAQKHIQELVKQLEVEKNIAQVNSITDSLTGLANRRYFDMALKTEFYRVKRSGQSLSLIMIDIDHFKKFNDSYGHLVGDDCLVKIGAMLKSIVGRAPDIVARYGGEEFVVILPETDAAGAKALAERIRKGVEVLGIPHHSSETAPIVTASLGVVSVNTTTLITPRQVVEMADEALYFAKSLGRNRTIVSDNQVKFNPEHSSMS